METSIVNQFQKIAAVAVLCMGGACATMAQTFPDRPIHLVLGFAPGGSADGFSRTVGQALSDRVKQPVVVDNRPGAGGTLAGAFVAKSPEDGYTLFMADDSTMGIAPFVYSNLGYNPAQDFAPISLSITQPMILVSSVASGIKDVPGLIAMAKSKPGTLNYGSPGSATLPHLAFELLKAQAGIDVTHVPYKGGPLVLADLAAGRVQLLFIGVNSALPFIQDGKVMAIGATSLTRIPKLPNVPTISESGIPGYSVDSYYGLVAPARTPKAVVDLLDREVRAALLVPEVSDKLARLGMPVAAGNADALAARIRDDLARYGPIVKKAGVRLN